MTAHGPDFIIIGAMKAATSTLHEQLALQSGFFMTTPKEPCFFSDDKMFDLGMRWYESLFATAPAGALRGESSTHYTKLPTYPKAVERLHAALPGVKLIYVMRHPVDRAISHYMHCWSEGQINCRLRDAVRQHPELHQYSCYGMQIEPYLERFGPQQVLPVFYESLKRWPQHELNRVAAFLGVTAPLRWDPSLPPQNVSTKRLRKSRTRDAIINLPGLRTVRRKFVPRRLRDRIKRVWTMCERPELAEEALQSLRPIFDEDLAKIEPWVGMRLTCSTWCSEVTKREACAA